MGLSSIFSERRLADRISSEQFGRNPELILKNRENGLKQKAKLTDISATGIGVVTSTELARGQIVILEHKGNARIANRAVVIWSQESMGRRFQSGLQFVRIP